MSSYNSDLEKRYFEEIIPKLDEKIVKMNLGRRINCCLVSAKIYTFEKLVDVIKNNVYIDMVIPELRNEIINKLIAMGELNEKS